MCETFFFGDLSLSLSLTSWFHSCQAALDTAFSLNRRQWQLEFAIRMRFDGMLQEDCDVLLVAPQALNVRVVESDGSYEHQLTLAEQNSVASVPWYSRGRANKRKKDEVLAADEPQLPVVTSHVPTTTPLAGQSLSDVPVLYVQIDPMLDHVGPMRQIQPASMWRAQVVLVSSSSQTHAAQQSAHRSVSVFFALRFRS